MTLFSNKIERVKGQSNANTVLNLTLPEDIKPTQRTVLKAVFVSYSSNVTVNALVTLDSGVGTAYDIRLATIVLTANRWGVYIPEVPIPLVQGDKIAVVAPAGGATITATVQIILDHETPMPEGVGEYITESTMGAR